MTLLIAESRQLECPVINRYTRLVVTLRLVVTAATNTLGAAISLDDIPYRWVERTGETLLSYTLTGSAGVGSLHSEQQQQEYAIPIHYLHIA